MNEGEGFNLTISDKELPQVKQDKTLSDSAEGITLGKKAEDQTRLAKQAVIKQALSMINIGTIYGTNFVTKGRVNHEAGFTPAEMEALAAVWSPLISVASPLTMAIITTGGILTAKAVMIMKLNDDRKKDEIADSPRQPNDTTDGTGSSSDAEPGRESNSISDLSDSVDSDLGIVARIPTDLDIASPTGNDGNPNSGDD